jgi:peptidyl-Asp metalloendopeptidase
MLNAVAAANAAYLASEVGIRLNVVGMVQTNYAETGDIAETLSRLRGTTDGYMDEIHALATGWARTWWP